MTIRTRRSGCSAGRATDDERARSEDIAHSSPPEGPLYLIRGRVGDLIMVLGRAIIGANSREAGLLAAVAAGVAPIRDQLLDRSARSPYSQPVSRDQQFLVSLMPTRHARKML
jgi:hypothetical protein